VKHVAIIGGGPAGLAAAACLADRDIPYTILERGDAPLAGLHALDPEMQLLTPPVFSRLPGMPARRGDHEQFGAVVKQFEAWRVARGLAVTTGAHVDRITHTAAGFTIAYGTRTLDATHVVNATGIIGHPVLPDDFDPAAYRGRWQHSLDVRSADLAATQRLVVVGAGMSAAEVIERWLDVRAPRARAWLSTRRPVVAAPQTILGIDIHYWLALPELAPGRLFGRRIGPARDLIIGRRIKRSLRDGAITQVPAITAYDVTFADGTHVEPDLLVFATGYRYGAEHLAGLVALDDRGHPIVDRHSASTRTPRLYLLGLRFGRTVKSAALRGITADAQHVAARIAKEP
jgi:hypothetical protein